jgi:hypothetical protein
MIVRENINFMRGQSSKKSLGVGRRFEIEEWFRKWQPEKEYTIDDDLTIHVEDSINLNGSWATYLPDNMWVDLWVDLEGAPINELPKNMIVMGNLILHGTPIDSLPDDLRVNGTISKDF